MLCGTGTAVPYFYRERRERERKKGKVSKRLKYRQLTTKRKIRENNNTTKEFLNSS
jgi:hypothetical protein